MNSLKIRHLPRPSTKRWVTHPDGFIDGSAVFLDDVASQVEVTYLDDDAVSASDPSSAFLTNVTLFLDHLDKSRCILDSILLSGGHLTYTPALRTPCATDHAPRLTPDDVGDAVEVHVEVIDTGRASDVITA